MPWVVQTSPSRARERRCPLGGDPGRRDERGADAGYGVACAVGNVLLAPWGTVIVTVIVALIARTLS